MHPLRLAAPVLAVLAGAPLAACSSFLSQSGPSRAAVVSGAAQPPPEPAAGSYRLVPLDAANTARLGADDPVPRFSTALTDAPVQGGLLGVGDTIGVTIFEAGAGGLFIPADPGSRSGNFVTLPARQIDGDGTISVPFAGEVRAAGLSTATLEREIDARLSGRALQPQAVVNVVDRRAGGISVTGEVGTAAVFSLQPGGERVLSAIARAGGPRFPAFEITVTIQRNDRTERALLSEIMTDPHQNVALRPGDEIYLAHTPRYFLAFGATGPAQSIGLVTRRFAFDDTHLSLADGLAKAGGLEDDRANAQAIFVYRMGRPDAAPAPEAPMTGAPTTGAPMTGAPMTGAPMTGAPMTPSLRADLPAGAQAGTDAPTLRPAMLTTAAPPQPTIYMLDLTRPDGYFRAREFRLHDGDTLFVSNSPSTDLGKFLALILPVAYSTSGFSTGFQ